MSFALNHLIGFGAGGIGPVTATFASSTFSGTDLTTYSFVGQGIGTASPDRLVVVGISGGAAASPRSVSSVSIGGNAATLYGTQSSNSNRCRIAYAGLLVTSGTTATIDVTWSGAMEQCNIVVWAVTGAGTVFAPFDGKFANGTGGTATVTTLLVPSGGAILSTAFFADSTAGFTGVTWTGPTEVADSNSETANVRYSAASLSNQSASSGFTTTAVANLDSDLGQAIGSISMVGI